MNKKSLEALIKAGALDRFGERGQLLANLEPALEYNKEVAKTNQNQQSLFSLMANASAVSDFKLKESPPALPQEKLIWEKELLGLYVSGHPLDKFKDKLEMIKIKIGEAKKLPNNMPVVVMGMIEEVKKIMTKKNEQMAFLKLSDYTDSIELVAFPSVLAKYGKMLYEGNCVGIKGKISVRNEEHSILCDEIKEPTNSN